MERGAQGLRARQSAECERSAGACRGIYGPGGRCWRTAPPRAPPRRRIAERGSARTAGARFTVEAPSAAAGAYLGALPQAHSAERARSPSSTGSTMSRRAILSSPRAKAFSRSSTSSATPPPAWPPTRARPRISTPWPSSRKSLDVSIPQVGLTTFRMPYTPVTFGSIRRHFARRSVRSGAHHADPRLGGGQGRGVRECRPVEARPLFPARGRGHARGGRARMPRGAQRLRHLRRLDARQDRGRRRRCRGVHEPPVRQQLVQSRRRPLALRDTAAATTASSTTTAWWRAPRRTAST